MSQATGNPLLGFVHRRRRGAELFLLVLALAVGIGAYAAVGIGVEGTVPADLVGYGGWLAALVIVAHLVVRATATYADPVLLPVVAALNGLGLAVIHRLDLTEDTGFAAQQLIWMTIGVGLFVATLLFLRDHRILTRFTYTSGLGAIVLLLLPVVAALNGLGLAIINRLDLTEDTGFAAQQTRSPWPVAGCCSSTCRAAATSARSSGCG